MNIKQKYNGIIMFALLVKSWMNGRSHLNIILFFYFSGIIYFAKIWVFILFWHFLRSFPGDSLVLNWIYLNMAIELMVATCRSHNIDCTHIFLLKFFFCSLLKNDASIWIQSIHVHVHSVILCHDSWMKKKTRFHVVYILLWLLN